MRVTIKKTDFNTKLICWLNRYNSDWSFMLTIQCMWCDPQTLSYKTKEERDIDHGLLLKTLSSNK
jgi:hypothetical protein